MVWNSVESFAVIAPDAFQGGQNLADSAKLQSLNTKFHLGNNTTPPFFSQSVEANNPEVTSALNSGFERIRVVDGVFISVPDPNDPMKSNYVPGGQADVDLGV